MRHVFILNPVAGKHQPALALLGEIKEACEAEGVDYAYHETKSRGDATRIAHEAIAGGEDVRLYACGGDGTLLEMIEAIKPNSRTEFAHIPCGSGNDFVRTIGGREPFLAIRDMVKSAAVPVDGILCELGDHCRHALNVAATGMDAAVAYGMSKFKKIPFVSGSMAYDIALAKVFFSKLGCKLSVEMDTVEGKVRTAGRYLFALAANGQYYGGGWRGAPLARVNDGLLDFVLVDHMSRKKILSLLPHYKAGRHPGKPGIHMWRGSSITITADEQIPTTLDGECFLADTMRISVMPGAYRMVMPDAVCNGVKAASAALCGV